MRFKLYKSLCPGLFPRVRAALCSKGGMTLLEMIVTLALITVASGILLFGIQSIFGLTIEGETRKQDQAALTELIALREQGEGTGRERAEGTLTLPGGHSVSGGFVTYEKGDVSFTVFEGDAYDTASPGD